MTDNKMFIDKPAYSTPEWCSLYGTPPFEFRDNRSMTILFKTTSNVLKELVPEPLVPNDEDIMSITFSRFFVSGFGSYHELLAAAPVTFDGKEGNFCIYLILDNDIALCAGREIWGFPKKYGRVELKDKDGVMTGNGERGGISFIRGAMQLEEYGTPEDAAGSPVIISAKLIPSVKKGALPEVHQLNSTTLQNMKFRNVYKGKATLEFGVSPADPFHRILIREVLGGVYVNSDFTLDYGEVIHDYLRTTRSKS